MKNDTKTQFIKEKLCGNFLVVGLVRNCQNKIRNDILKLKSALGAINELHWLLIESDSDDGTVDQLEELVAEIHNFRYLSLGNLRDKMPLRTERLAYCRNTYVDEILKNPIYKSLNFIVVSDFDGINTHINKLAIDSCWYRNDWTAVFANQRGPYYDVWTLRVKDWCAGDCWGEFRFYSRYIKNKDKVLRSCIYSKMITVPVGGDWIEVDSAFGGLAIYKREIFNKSKYNGLNEFGQEVCCHVNFNEMARKEGAKLFINPNLVNAEITEHTKQLIFPGSAARWIFCSLKLAVYSLVECKFISEITHKLKNRLNR